MILLVICVSVLVYKFMVHAYLPCCYLGTDSLYLPFASPICGPYGSWDLCEDGSVCICTFHLYCVHFIYLGISFFTELYFFQAFGANPVPWDVNNKTMPFFNKNCFLGSRTRGIPNFGNTSGCQKIKFSSRYYFRDWMVRLDERFLNVVSKLSLGNVLNLRILAKVPQKTLQSWFSSILTCFRPKYGSNVRKLNIENRFGILSSRRVY